MLPGSSWSPFTAPPQRSPFTVPPSSSWSPFNAPCWRSPSSSLPQRSPSLCSAGGALYHAALEELFIVPRCSCSPSLRRPRGAHHHSAWLFL